MGPAGSVASGGGGAAPASQSGPTKAQLREVITEKAQQDNVKQREGQGPAAAIKEITPDDVIASIAMPDQVANLQAALQGDGDVSAAFGFMKAEAAAALEAQLKA